MSELPDQKRVVIASVLSLLVVIVWSFLYRPATPPPGQANSAPKSSTASANANNVPSQPAPSVTAAAASPSAVGDATERTIVVENDLYRVEFSNRGAVVRSWRLKKYTDADRKPLDLVHPEAARENGNWPLSLEIADAQTEQTVNGAFYLVKPSSAPVQDTLKAPAELEFDWSDGQVAVTKQLKFDDSYIVRVDTSVQRGGQPIAHRIAWLGGFGDFAVPPAQRAMSAFTDAAGSIRVIAAGALGVPNQRTTFSDQTGAFEAVGIEDRSFAAAFMPPDLPGNQSGGAAIITLSGRELTRNTVVDGQSQQELLPEIAAGTTASGPLAVRLFVGPKDLDILKAVRPPLDSLVQFGWFGFIAAPLFYVLRWLHNYIPNYGWAIVVLTAAINTLLYPLTLRSWRSMQRMQRVAPEIRSIQDRYKKYAMRDPRKQEMNKEVMAVYSREGINPLGSCLPMLVQFPIWYGINRMITATLELRHAQWLWIADLSVKDPYYVLPVFMAILMYVQQKMTPMTATDPSQQRMMNLMPLMMGGMFIFLPLSSGLVLYILTSNAVGIAQRWHLNRTAPIKGPAKRDKTDRAA